MNIATQTCTEFLEALASKAPVPGGGGASALVGAVGVALGLSLIHIWVCTNLSGFTVTGGLKTYTCLLYTSGHNPQHRHRCCR